MYTVSHFLWLVICASLIVGTLIWLNKNKPSLKSVFSIACIGCIISEFIKVFSARALVPSADGTQMRVYIETGYVPLHLCSIQIIFIFFCRFAKESKAKETLLAFMYPTCTLGAFFALMIPTLFDSQTTLVDAFARSHPYEYFLYHAMLVILGLYIPMSKQVDIKAKNYFTSVGILGVLAFLSLYLNSIFATPIYQNGELKSVEYTTNFFFTYETPIGIEFTEIWQWYVYLVVILLLALVLIGIFYIPYFIKAKREKEEGKMNEKEREMAKISS